MAESSVQSRPPWINRINIPGPGGLVAPAIVLILIGAFIFVWYFCRIEPGAGELAILIRKTGEELPSGAILALEDGQKGIQLEVLPEGRYFRDPYNWGWKISTVLDIPANKLGVQTRLYGEDLPAGRVLAEGGTKGIVRDVLRPGKHRINPYATRVDIFDAMTIRPGHVGVVTSLIGADVMNDELPADRRNQFLVHAGMKGIVEDVLDPGTYYLNPYVVSVTEVNLRSQRFEMSGEDAISFLTLDGFNVIVEGTIEFAIVREHAAWITHRVGDMDDILTKIILPRARGFSRIEGSKYPANNFIVGTTRQIFQNNLARFLTERSEPWGVEIRSLLIRNIVAPDEISSVIREREVAVQNALKYGQQIEQAKSKAELTKQEMLAVQNRERVEAETKRLRAEIEAQQMLAVAVTGAERALAVAEIENRSADYQVAARIAEAEGERDAIRVGNTARAVVLRRRTKAFDGGMEYARYMLYNKVAPRIERMMTSDGPDGLGALFAPLMPADQPIEEAAQTAAGEER